MYFYSILAFWFYILIINVILYMYYIIQTIYIYILSLQFYLHDSFLSLVIFPSTRPLTLPT